MVCSVIPSALGAEKKSDGKKRWVFGQKWYITEEYQPEKIEVANDGVVLQQCEGQSFSQTQKKLS